MIWNQMGNTQKQERVLAEFQGSLRWLPVEFLFWKPAVTLARCSVDGVLCFIGKAKASKLLSHFDWQLFFFLILCWKMFSWKVTLTLELSFLPLFQGGQALFSQKKWKIRQKVWKGENEEESTVERNAFDIFEICEYFHPAPCVLPTCHGDRGMQHLFSPHNILCHLLLYVGSEGFKQRIAKSLVVPIASGAGWTHRC